LATTPSCGIAAVRYGLEALNAHRTPANCGSTSKVPCFSRCAPSNQPQGNRHFSPVFHLTSLLFPTFHLTLAFSLYSAGFALVFFFLQIPYLSTLHPNFIENTSLQGPPNLQPIESESLS
jgi:hypothetical protein